MEKINIAELLKDCPTGMELDCTMFEDVHFDHISDCGKFIYCYINYKDRKTSISFNKYGAYCNLDKSKCVIFPKGKTTWEGFQRPFKDGDIIYNKFIQAVAIFCKQTDEGTISHCFLNRFKELKIKHYHSKFLTDWRLAPEEEKQKLFDEIEMNGYKWNAETKTLEKLPEFKDGDILFVDCGEEEDDKSYQYIFILKDPKFYGKWHSYCHLDGVGNLHLQRTYLTDDEYHPRLATEEEKEKLFKAIKDNGYKWNVETKTYEKLVEPKFKVGDKVREKGDEAAAFTISDIDDSCYYYGKYVICNICDQDEYELVPNKFDINTLKPFDKVLVRDSNKEMWRASMFSHTWKDKFFCIGAWYNQCIPYEANKELLGTTNDCEEYYKIWEK